MKMALNGLKTIPVLCVNASEVRPNVKPASAKWSVRIHKRYLVNAALFAMRKVSEPLNVLLLYLRFIRKATGPGLTVYKYKYKLRLR